MNPPENVAEGYSAYIEIEERDLIRKKPALLAQYAHEVDGKLHLRLLPDGRCKALKGRVGSQVRCAIYHTRPTPCRRVEPGSDQCRMYQRFQGLLSD